MNLRLDPFERTLGDGPGHEVFTLLGSGFFHTRMRLYDALTHPLVRVAPQIPLVYRSFYWYSPEQKLISEHYHRQLTTALAARDAERAEIVMKEHVLEARDFLVARVRTWEPTSAGSL